MAITYCNLTTDLVEAYANINQFNRRTRQVSTDAEDAGGNVWFWEQTGYYEMVFEDGEEMTAGSNITPSAGEFYYDAGTDRMYVHYTGSVAPSTLDTDFGVDWDQHLTRARNNAQEMLEGYLKSVFVVPFQKIVAPVESYNSRLYDYWIIRATALLTCFNVVNAINPGDPITNRLLKEVFNPIDPNVITDERPGIVQDILEGRIALKTQRVAREAGGFNYYEASGNSATSYWEISGYYTGSNEEIWRVQIDTAGAPGTATYKLSKDQGGSFDETLQETMKSDSDNERIHLGSGIYCRFDGTYVLNDYIDIRLFPASDQSLVQPVGSIRLVM